MKQKPTSNKAEKFAEEEYFRQNLHKDKEKRKLVSEIYGGGASVTKKKKKKLKGK